MRMKTVLLNLDPHHPIPLRRYVFFRLFFCLAVLGSVLQHGFLWSPSLESSNGGLWNPLPFWAFLKLPFLSPVEVKILFSGLCLSLIVSAWGGPGGRFALGTATVGFLLYFGFFNGYEMGPDGRVYHERNILFFGLLLLWASPKEALSGIFSAQTWRSERKAPQYGLLLIQWTLGLAYLASGISKLRSAGLGWVDRNTFRGYLMSHFLYYNDPLLLELIQWPIVCQILSFLALGWELFFLPLQVCLPKKWPLILGGLLFHLSIARLFHLPIFLNNFFLIYLAFMDFPSLKKLLFKKN